MNEETYVSLEQHACIVCDTAFDTAGPALASEHGAPYDDWLGPVPEHQKLFDDGFVVLVECDPRRRGSQASGRTKPEQAYRRAGWPMCGARPSRGCLTCRSRTSRLPAAPPSVRRSFGSDVPFFLLHRAALQGRALPAADASLSAVALALAKPFHVGGIGQVVRP